MSERKRENYIVGQLGALDSRVSSWQFQHSSCSKIGESIVHHKFRIRKQRAKSTTTHKRLETAQSTSTAMLVTQPEVIGRVFDNENRDSAFDSLLERSSTGEIRRSDCRVDGGEPHKVENTEKWREHTANGKRTQRNQTKKIGRRCAFRCSTDLQAPFIASLPHRSPCWPCDILCK